ncbi:MAG: alpha-glucosidase [Burkholderiaceae bacterium]|nr:alpha-glucosidase [Burkholderiaceae bacterium]
MTTATKWWQSAVFYQIYPRSFADGNGDGIGDFPGITARLDHLRDLGIGAIWLSPHFPSPFVDCGYDISDFDGVAPEYGTMADFHHFLREAHARGIRVVLDLVLNHSSDQHPWFGESRASRDNPKRDWYVWRDGQGGGPPNNWISVFGGPAWTLDPRTGQYYYHAFLKEQPDLNWRHPALKQAMFEMVRFWLGLGVDGFRLDAIGAAFEHPDLPPHRARLTPLQQLNPLALSPDEWRSLMEYQQHQSGVHELMKELRRLVDVYPGDRVLIGEDDDVAFHGNGDDELHLVFNFPLMRAERLTPAHIRANQAARLAALGPNWPCNTLGNHDGRRLWSRFGDGLHDAALSRLHLALMATLRGTPVLYNGEEIGMTDLELTDLAQFRDTAALARYRLLTTLEGLPPAQALASVAATTRDRCRGPLQWSDEANGGFCPPGVAPWLPVNADHAGGVNVADQDRDPGSLLNFYRRVLALRKATPALLAGDYRALDEDNEDVLAFLRHDAASGQTCLVALNFAAAPRRAAVGLAGSARVLLASAGGRAELGSLDALALAPHEVLIAELAA